MFTLARLLVTLLTSHYLDFCV